MPRRKRPVGDREQREREARDDAPREPLNDAILPAEFRHDEQQSAGDQGRGYPFDEAQPPLAQRGFEKQYEQRKAREAKQPDGNAGQLDRLEERYPMQRQ